MSLDAATKFAAKMDNDDALKNKVFDAIDGKSVEDAAAAFVALGKANGFDFTPEDAIALYNSAVAAASGEMSNAELSGVAGGGSAIGGKASTNPAQKSSTVVVVGRPGPAPAPGLTPAQQEAAWAELNRLPGMAAAQRTSY